jgi:RND family efflux transporter MFP subunit
VLTGKPKPEVQPQDDPLKPVVSVIVTEPRDMVLAVTTQGTVEARRRISLVAQVGGKVAGVAENFVEGAFFEAGDVLLTIEPEDYEFAIARAQSQVAAAEQRVAEERGRNRQAKREWRELGSAEANALFLREPQLKAAEAALMAAQADLAAAELALARTRITVPFSGRIESTNVDLGQYMTPGTPLAQAYGIDIVEVRLPLSDKQLAALNLPLHGSADLSRPVTLSTEFGGRQWQWVGEIRRIDAVVDRDSRVVHAVAEVDNPFAPTSTGRPPLAPGMFVQADIVTPAISNLVQLPASALRSDNSLLIVSAEEKLERQVVNVVRRTEDWVWVSGLRANLRIVGEQTPLLMAGLSVDVEPMNQLSGVN